MTPVADHVQIVDSMMCFPLEILTVRTDRALPVIPLLETLGIGHDVSVKDGHRDSHRHAGVRSVD
jgi:hypothetical protein